MKMTLEPCPYTRALLMDSLKAFAITFNRHEAKRIYIPKEMTDIIKSWSTNEIGGLLFEELQEGSYPEEFVGCIVTWNYDGPYTLAA